MMTYRTLMPIVLALSIGIPAWAQETKPPQPPLWGPAQRPPPDQRPLITYPPLNPIERLYFEPRSAALDPDAMKALDVLAASLLNHPRVLLYLEAHADGLEAESRPAARELSEARAQAVRQYLVARGVDGARLGPVAIGQDQPRVLGDNEAARRANRRVDINVCTGSGR